MRRRECPREREVAAGASRGMIDDEVREHARNCALCLETLVVASALGELSRADDVESPSVSARVLWLKAQLAPRLDPQGASYVAGGSAAVWIAVASIWAVVISWRWSELRMLVEQLSPGKLMVSGGDLGSIPVASLVVVGLMVTVTMAIMLHQVWVEEL